MDKIKLTKDQIHALKGAIFDYGSDVVMDMHSEKRWTNNCKALNELSNHELAKALYVGYESIGEIEARLLNELKHILQDYVSEAGEGEVEVLERLVEELEDNRYLKSMILGGSS